MAVLTAKQRKSAPASAWAYPKQRKFYIGDVSHARNALARAAQKGTKGSYTHVAKAVRRKYGGRIASVGRARGTVTRPGYKRTRRK